MRTLTVTAVAAAAAAAATLTGCGNLTFGTREESRSYTAPAGIGALKIQTDGSLVEVTATDSPTIKVSEKLRWSNDHNKPDAKHVTAGGTLTLSAECAAASIGATNCGVSYRVQVPRSVPVEIDNDDGSIKASGLGGVVKLHSDNGAIEAHDLRASSASISSADGSVRVSGRATTADLRSDNGQVSATGLTADRLTAHTSDGGIRLGGNITTADVRTDNGSIEAGGLTTERLTAKTSNGSIGLGLAAAPTDVRAETDNGSIRVYVPGGQGYAINANTDNGGRRIDPGVQQDPQSSHHLTLDTSNGSITVTPADQRSW